MVKFCTMLVAGITALTAVPSLAQAPVAPLQGPDCGAMVAQFGPRRLWQGRFSGGREVELFFDSTQIQWYAATACFRSKVECDRWLYALNTQFQDRPETSICRRLGG
jgi:hypothetical protein